MVVDLLQRNANLMLWGWFSASLSPRLVNHEGWHERAVREESSPSLVSSPNTICSRVTLRGVAENQSSHPERWKSSHEVQHHKSHYPARLGQCSFHYYYPREFSRLVSSAEPLCRCIYLQILRSETIVHGNLKAWKSHCGGDVLCTLYSQNIPVRCS